MVTFMCIILVVIIVLSLLNIAVYEALLKDKDDEINKLKQKRAEVRLVDLTKPVEYDSKNDGLKRSGALMMTPMREAKNKEETHNREILAFLSDSSRCMKNIELSSAGGDFKQAEDLRDFFLNVKVRKYIDDRNPRGFIYIAAMFEALADKIILEAKRKIDDKIVDKKD